jgi:hypothetical protein
MRIKAEIRQWHKGIFIRGLSEMDTSAVKALPGEGMLSDVIVADMVYEAYILVTRQTNCRSTVRIWIK